MAKWFADAPSGRCFRHKHGPRQGWNSWDAEKMAERERARRQAREDKDARHKFEGGAK